MLLAWLTGKNLDHNVIIRAVLFVFGYKHFILDVEINKMYFCHQA